MFLICIMTPIRSRGYSMLVKSLCPTDCTFHQQKGCEKIVESCGALSAGLKPVRSFILETTSCPTFRTPLTLALEVFTFQAFKKSACCSGCCPSLQISSLEFLSDSQLLTFGAGTSKMHLIGTRTSLTDLSTYMESLL